MSQTLTDAEVEFLLGVTDLARTGDADELARLLDAGVPANLTNAAGDSLLILAAYHDHESIVQLLLDRGADVERVNDRGQTALGAAVFRSSETNVRALLSAGADPDHGARSARQIAEFFALEPMRALLDEHTVPAQERPSDATS